MLISLFILLLLCVPFALPRDTSWLVGSAKHKFGPQHSLITHNDGTKYLERYIWYVGIGTIRLHKFWSGDDVRAPHDHPWWFITFPFTSYREKVFVVRSDCGPIRTMGLTHRDVHAFRFHYRPAEYCHIVLSSNALQHKPFWTFVLTGNKIRNWGFWPIVEGAWRQFVYWRNWK